MRANDLVYETVSALTANRARSLLTILGVVIGIAAVIAMTAMIGGMKMSMVGNLGLSQARLVEMSCYSSRPVETRDVDAMATEMKSTYEFVTPISFAYNDVSSSTEKVGGMIKAVQPEFADATDIKLAEGRFISEEDEADSALVVVLDQPSVRNLFGTGTGSAVGKTVSIEGADYTVVGVVETEGASIGAESANLYMPFSTCGRRLLGSDTVDTIYGFAYEGADMDAVAEASEEWLAKHFQIPEDEQDGSIYVTTMKSAIDQLNSTMASFQILMTSVASISLVVGGIGIMNMMLTNVTERIREIGLRKALGARRRDITRQFLLESVCLTLIGGVIGIAVGYLGAFALSGMASDAMMGGDTGPITPYLEWQSILLVAGICIAIGIAFGYYPARRAASLDPVESLHYQ